jgi:putative hydroxymethylpyrimidine transport system substrate-binding protein
MLLSELADARSPLTDRHGLGWQSEDQWQALADMLQQAGVLGEINVRDGFTTLLLDNQP